MTFVPVQGRTRNGDVSLYISRKGFQLLQSFCLCGRQIKALKWDLLRDWAAETQLNVTVTLSKQVLTTHWDEVVVGREWGMTVNE